MSKIQKSFACIAFISMLFGIFASCSSDDSDSSEKKKPKSSSSGVSSSSGGSGTSVTLACTGLQRNVEKGGTIETPDLKCSNDRDATDIKWNGRPSSNKSWDVDPDTEASSYTIIVSATCGSYEIDASCGTVKVIAAGGGSSSSVAGGSSSSVAGGSSSSKGGSSSGTAVTLTCTGLQETVAKGDTIKEPTLTCTGGAILDSASIAWNGLPLDNSSWTVPATSNLNSYNIKVSAKCGSVNKQDVSCGEVTVTVATSSSGGSAGSSSGSSAGSSSGSSAGSSSDSSAGSSSGSSAGSSSDSSAGSSADSSAGSSSDSSAGGSSSASESVGGRPWFKLKR